MGFRGRPGLGLEFRGQGNFEDLDIFGVGDLDVADARGLVHESARLEQDLSTPFIVDFGPALENVDQLHVEGVPLLGRRTWCSPSRL